LTLKETSLGLHVLVSDLDLMTHLRPAFKNRLWFELVRPGFSPDTEARLLEQAKKLGIRPVASLGVHYAKEVEDRFRDLPAALVNAKLFLCAG
jgi:hypothetical protein